MTRRRPPGNLSVSPEVAARGRAAAADPDCIARRAEKLRGKPPPPNTAKALKAAASKPKPEGWGARANVWMQAAKRQAE